MFQMNRFYFIHYFSYSSEWQNLNEIDKKSLRIIQINLNIPITINAYGLIVVSMDFYIQV